MQLTNIAENLAIVRERIARAAESSGRAADEIALIAVTKTLGVERVREAIASGVTDIGENYVQESVRKWQEIGSEGAKWHFIGHLQRNKARQAVETFSMIQSVDSITLAEEIGRRAVQQGKQIEVLIEVRISEEDTKFGVVPEETLALAEQISQVEGIKMLGLMGMPPYAADPECTRPYFARLKSLWNKLPKEQQHWLSMGMSHDFEAAIMEGSNMVRIGTAIFGPRA